MTRWGGSVGLEIGGGIFAVGNAFEKERHQRDLFSLRDFREQTGKPVL